MSLQSVAKPVLSLAFFGTIAAIAWHDRNKEEPERLPDGGSAPFRMFENAKRLGIDFRHANARFDDRLENVMPHIAAMGAAVSVCDVDGNRWPDLYATTSAAGGTNGLFVNQGDGTFRERAAEFGLADMNQPGTGACMGSIWADYDNDGDEDAFVYRYGYTALLRNDGARFSEVGADAGVRRWMNSNAAVWLDYDRDGFVDLYVTGYFREELDLWHLRDTKIMQESFEFAENGGHNYLYRNLGNGRFEDVTARAGVDSTRWTLGVAAADLDGNGWPDLYLANDYGTEELFRNVDGTHFERWEDIGLDESSKSGMCVALGDFENRGELGVFVTNISAKRFLLQGNNLRTNRLREKQKFFNVAGETEANCGWAWGAQFGDFDLDGFEDLFVANGFISASQTEDYWFEMGKIAGAVGALFEDSARWQPIGQKSLSGYERSRVLWSKQGRGFSDVASIVGVDDLYDGRAVALADLDRDGALEVIVANQQGPLLVYSSEPPAGRHWLALELAATTSNRSAIGAEVVIRFGPHVQRAVVDGGSGFCAQNERALHFGLGAATEAEVTVRWPSGREQALGKLAADVRHLVAEAD